MSASRFIGLAVVFVVVVGVGCGTSVEKRACMKLGTSDSLVTDAALLRLDVYGAGVACRGSSVDDSAGAPTMTATYKKGDTISLSVPPGPHTLVLTTYSDGAGKDVLGQGCQQTTLTPGAQICFDLSLAKVTLDLAVVVTPDLAGPTMPSGCTMNSECADAGTMLICDTTMHQCVQCVSNGDCPSSEVCNGGVCATTCNPAAGIGCAAGATCCGGACVDTTSNAANCGGCGNACDQTNSFGAKCVASSCTYASCRSGWMNCNTTPPDSDGCETHTDVDVENCGGCGRDCKSGGVNQTSCTAGLCTSTCNAGFANCTEPSAPTVDDGCETNAYTPAHCGTTSAAACMTTCAYSHATALCPAGTCAMGSCASGYYDCDQSASDGCEAAGPTTGPGCCSGTTPATTGTKQTQHSDGLGDGWFDCQPLNTYTMAEAQAAGAAFDSTGTIDQTNNHYSDSKGTVDYICNASTAKNACPCWAWQGTGSYAIAAGHVDEHSGGVGNCYFPLDNTFPAWH